MDEFEWWNELDEDCDSEELEEGISSSSSLSNSMQDSLELEDRLELEEFVHQLTSEILHKAMMHMELEMQVELEVHLEQAGVFWGPPSVDEPVAELPGSCVPVEFAEEETQVRILVVEEEREQEHQTKSWWRRQADRLWKAIKSAGNFCLGCMRSVPV